MKINYALGVLIAVMASPVYALESLDDHDLQQIEGQAGADLSLKLSLNHTPYTPAAGTVAESGAGFDTALCSDLRYCRLGIALNNRYDDGTQDTINTDGSITVSPTGKKQWLVFKGIQGTIYIPEIKLDGEDVTWGGSTTKAAIKLSFDKNKPIQIRNLGFQSLSIETDTAAQETGTPGYLNNEKYTAGNTFDGKHSDIAGVGRERGFLGLNINTNLALTGSIKMFSCGSGHPRCS